jgi:predicted anti-sigma-YlaC factor YlaD
MDCGLVRRLMNDRLDGGISADDDRALETHLAGCPSCGREWALMAALDGVLADEAVEAAPAGFELSVMMAVAQRAAARQRAESVGVPAACAIASVAVGYGVHRLVNWEAVRTLVRGLGDAATAPLAEPVAEASVLAQPWLENPAVQGAIIAFAVAATIFLGVSAIRTLRQHSLEWR